MPESLLNACSLTGVAAALAEALGIEKPLRAEDANPLLARFIRESFSSGRADRVFMYNPDAVAMWLWQKYTPLFADVVRHTQLALPLRTVMPSVTPHMLRHHVHRGPARRARHPEVRKARDPHRHPLRRRAARGEKVRHRRGHEVQHGAHLPGARHGLLHLRDHSGDQREGHGADRAGRVRPSVRLQRNYDSTMHKNGPEAAVSLEALQDNVRSFDRFARAIAGKWAGHDTLIGFAMDHGCHEIDGDCGSHGLDMPEDLNIQHFYGALPRR